MIEKDKLKQKVLEEKIVIDFEYNNRPIIKIWSLEPIILRDIFYIFEDLKLILEKDEIKNENIDNQTIYISKYYFKSENLESIRKNIKNVFTVIKETILTPHRCQLYPLSYLENISLRDISLLRTLVIYTKNLKLIPFQNSIKAILNNSKIIKELLGYFDCKFNPNNLSKDRSCKSNLHEKINSIKDLEEYKIISALYKVVQNMVRTNYYLNKNTISFKVFTSNIDLLNSIEPNIETFVYHKEFKGVHLRMDKVSRGGLRHSNRLDFRDEIKSLMITQDSKNSIIVPRGAKGGFKINDDIKITYQKFEEIYTIYINSILDLVDNIVDNKIVKNEKIVAYDGDDTYLVVAADKGTSAMSDVANSISINRNFWLKDAFASGGSNGYNHKELGITAKGAIKSNEIFFKEKGINIYEDSISIVGIGSMSGDVFGNGILESDKFRLIGAISSKEIFIDPNPNPQISYNERQRLFKLPKASWSDYDKNIISKGGEVFRRDEKFCKLTPQIKELLNTTKDALSGEQLAQEVLKLNVDMLFNGGVGTYVKASFEENSEIGDKQNESLRVNAKELKAFCVCEGGNLGFTQKARIEFAKYGGKISTDAIDNSAGVNTSDYEVNIKILLSSNKNSSSLLKLAQDSVVNKVLSNNISQSACLENELVRINKDDLLDIISILEKNSTIFKKEKLYIPNDENLEVLRPILAIVLAYSKLLLKDFILENISFDEKFNIFLENYFPENLFEECKDEILNHQLKDKIIATSIVNKLIDKHGISFIKDFENKETMINKVTNQMLL
jgi:glutamate dehydrogenase